ncbi:MAG: galactitol-1-phosphate 5-dehydrogenase [Lachnospiraceae bacterium]|jgi:L-iditol 2-dehydrogenase|nr:galactitol-1-phosphate 5-dehydrogenase [Lachnospiraceae bacterium]
MKAFVLHGIGDFRFETAPMPILKEDEVLVSVKAAGICGSDIPRVYRTGAYAYPLIPGHEFSGVVAETGKNTDSRWKGKRVGIFPLIPCGSCVPCQKGQYEMCRHYSYLGSRRNGGFAEYAAVPAANLVALPDNVTFEEAAMLEPMAVAAHAMRRIAGSLPSKSQSAEENENTVAVWGQGTIGLLLIAFLMEAGFSNILAIGNKEFQKEAAIHMGLQPDRYCDSKTQDVSKWIMEQTNGLGVDLFFECVGKNETAAQAVDNAAPGGKIMLVGNPYSDMTLEKAVYWKILRNQLTITGTWNSSYSYQKDLAEDDWDFVLKWLSARKINPQALITHRFPLNELEQGFHIMRDKKEDYVKIIGCL